MNSVYKAFRRKKEKGWDKIYVSVDLHETIITPTYKKLNDGATFYDGAIEVLKKWTDKKDVCLILWTSSHQTAIDDILIRLSTEGIKFEYINENPEVASTDICDFSRKYYIDLVLDDKGFFDATKDWFRIKETLIEIGEW